MYWCLGMYGSASTWTFNLVQKLAATLRPERPVLPRFVAESLADLDPADGTCVVKTHASPVAAELARRASAIIITIRDPRDAIASLMAHNKAPFDLALHATEATALMCQQVATHPLASLFRFEDRFYDKHETIEKIAAYFGRSLSDKDRDRLFSETRREAVETLIAGFGSLPTVVRDFDELTGQQDTYDPATGWHAHHAGRSGEIGRWRRALSASQVAAIERGLADWMRSFGYMPSTPAPKPYTLNVGRYEITQ